MRTTLPLIVILIGSLLLLNSLGVFHFRWDIFWPLAIIAIGIGMLWRRSRI